MAELAPSEFGAFFRDVHGYEPFPWQKRLAARVHREGWPTVIDLPTGSGKTAVLDVAVFALATNPSVAPRRIVFVIDRRIVVDQVCERADRIRSRIRAGDTSVLRLVRNNLQALAGGEPLGVVALRGGIPIDGAWTHRPDQPWVLVSTVDQFGSGLLFRGYGVNPGMLPIHAALAGNDCLVILDEVHLSAPFAETLEHAAALPVGPLPRRFHVVKMSATPGSEPDEPFRLDPVTDLDECEKLSRRVRSKKTATLELVRNRDALPAAVLRLVRSTGKPGTHRVTSVGVVLNRVRSARETHRMLAEAGVDAHLLTGRMRPLDRSELLEAMRPAVDPDRSGGSDRMTVVVATQAIEVGADFSFDALITECAPVDSLRQRFGRLDRRGTCFVRSGLPAQAWILGLRTLVAGNKPDPIYGDAVKATWAELERLARVGPIDVGPESLATFPEDATAPRPRAPTLLDTHIDAWVQTSPRPIVQPPIEWFLHGIDRAGIPEVRVVWRRDRTEATLKLVPPRQAESLPVPIDAARSWLSGGPETEIADVQGGAGTEEAGAEAIVGDCLRWRGIGKPPERIDSVADIRPGDTLVVDPDRGGLRSHTWDPSSEAAVEDLGDAAQEAHGRRVTLRLDPELPASTALSPAAPSPPTEEPDDDVPARERIQEWLDALLTDADGMPEWLVNTVTRLGGGFEYTSLGGGDSASYYVLTERHPSTRRAVVDPAVMDSSDEAGSMTGSSVTLRRHLDGVAARTREAGTRLGLSREIVEDMGLAARLHDIGKVDPRFQAQLVGGDPVDLAMLDEPLAKSLPGVPRVRLYPQGMRHELASAALAGSDPGVLARAHDPDLVLHLIATHHGWARPLPPVVEDPDPQVLSYSFDGRSLRADSELSRGSMALDLADRFWRLVDRYGYYGLAWLEAILRLADHRESAEEVDQP